VNPFLFGGVLLLAAFLVAIIVSIFEVLNDRCPRCKSRRIVNDETEEGWLRCLDCGVMWQD
jgi:TFIIB zinc-binding protein